MEIKCGVGQSLIFSDEFPMENLHFVRAFPASHVWFCDSSGGEAIARAEVTEHLDVRLSQSTGEV